MEMLIHNLISNSMFIYLYYYMSMLVHEMGHYIVALAYNIPVLGIHIGNTENFCIPLGKLKLSLWGLASFVEIEEEDLARLDNCGRNLFYTAGIVANIILYGVTLVFLHNIMPAKIITIFTVALILENMCPFFPNSDISALIRIKKCKEV